MPSLQGSQGGAKKVPATPVKTPQGAAKVTANVGAKVSSQDEVWLCPWDGASFSSAPALRGHWLGSHSRAAGTVSEPASPVGDPLVDSGPLPSSLGLQKEMAQSAILEKTRVLAEVSTRKAEAELERFTGGGNDAQVEGLRQRIDQLQRENYEQRVEMRIATMQAQTNSQLQDIKAAVTRLGEVRQSNGGHSSTISDALQLAAALRPPSELALIKQAQETGLVGRPDGGPTSELAARSQIALEKMRGDREDRAKREERDVGLQDRVIGLADRAVQTIADPVARALGDSMRIKATQPSNPGSASGRQPTAEEVEGQLRQIEQHRAEVDRIESDLRLKLEQLQPPPAPSSPPLERVPFNTGEDGIVLGSPLRPVDSGVGQVHARTARREG